MYNKAGVPLRIETVINYPYDFKVYRSGMRRGEQVNGRFPLSKKVSYLYRYEQIVRTANGRYLNDPFPARKDLQELVESVNHGHRRVTDFNHAREQDQDLFAEIPRSRKWRITTKGYRLLGALRVFFENYDTLKRYMFTGKNISYFFLASL